MSAPRITKAHGGSFGAIVSALRHGGVGVLPTDTLYGIVGSALDEKVIRRIYRLRKRSTRKPMIVLVSSISDVRTFGIRLEGRRSKIVRQLWPGPVSIIFPCKQKRFTYLHRGTQSLAIRLPADQALRNLLRKTGPLVAPSANWEEKKPSRTVGEAFRYFGGAIDFYVDAGIRRKEVGSTLIHITRGVPIIVREGAGDILVQKLAE